MDTSGAAGTSRPPAGGTSLNGSLNLNLANMSLSGNSFLGDRDRSLVLNGSTVPAAGAQLAPGVRTPKNKTDQGGTQRERGRSHSATSTSNSKSKTPRLGKSPSAAPAYDRFIPKRSSSSNLSASLSLKGSLEDSIFQDGDASPRTVENRRNLSNALLAEQKKDRILEFRARPPPAPEGSANPFSSLYTHAVSKTGANNAKKIPRAIPTVPSRILDAPDLLNDYYLTRLDWGSNNILAVALGPSVFLWNGETAEIQELFSIGVDGEERYISGVSWLQGGHFLAVGTNNAEVQIWDTYEKRKVRTLLGHSARVGCLDWNNHILASGCRSGAIHYHDVRVKEYYFCSLKAHAQEVCGLRWSPDKRYLASGGNDNVLNIWPHPSPGQAPALAGTTGGAHEHPVHSFNLHQAAVKAIAWCPWQPSVLASGGGTADRSVKVWNINMGSLITSKDTGSQVSGLVWSEEYREVVTGHGYAKNELILWKYPSFERIAELTGHTERILDLCLSADGSTVVSSGADETIRLWNMFPVDLEKRKKTERDKAKPSGLARQCIR